MTTVCSFHVSLPILTGPSLLVYNNAVFTEDDFKSIQRIGDSVKKTEETKSKIGIYIQLFSVLGSVVADCVCVLQGALGSVSTLCTTSRNSLVL